MEKLKKSFNDFEKFLLKTVIGVLIYSVIIFGVIVLLGRINEDYLRYLQYFIAIGLLSSLIIFLIAGIRILRYLVAIKDMDKEAKISSSIIALFVSLLSFAISFLSLLIVALASIW